MDTFTRGASIPRTITLTDGTDNLDTSDFLTIEVKVKHKYYGVDLGTYTLADSEITKETPTTGGQITFIIPATSSTNKSVGVYSYQVTTTETDTDYENNVRTRRLVPDDCFMLKGQL